MRKVKFNKYVKVPFQNGHKNEWQKDFPNEGLFHQWGLSSTDDICTDTVAIIEMADGSIETVFPTHMQFIQPDTSNHIMD